MSKSKVRLNPRQRADFYVNKVIDDELHMARVRDISAGGCFLYKLLEPETTEDELALEMVLPGSNEIIWAAGEVVRQQEQNGVEGNAIKFTRISEQHRKLISDYVETARGQKEAE